MRAQIKLYWNLRRFRLEIPNTIFIELYSLNNMIIHFDRLIIACKAKYL